MMRILVVADIALLILYPIAWMAPIATAGLFPWLGSDNVTILGAVRDLWSVDPALSVLVAALALALPYAKTLALLALHLGRLGQRMLPVIEGLGRLSMADVFLIAVWIVVIKGVGIGRVDPAWGLWLFTGCVLAGIAIGWQTQRARNG